MRIRFIILTLVLFATLLSAPAWAKYRLPELDKVPVERVLTNLADRAAEAPKDAALQFNLARAYAMAYASKTPEVDVRKENQELWFGFEPRNVPFQNKPTDDKAVQATAEKNLAKAIETYELGLKLAPDNLVGRLGYGWSLEQAGQKAAAIEQYRKVIAEAWKKEGQLTRAGLGFHSLTAEAGRYLTPLLDKDKDAAEIADIAERTKKVQSIPRPVTPIAIPLQAGLTARDMEDRATSVRFDADGSGVVKNWSWIKPIAGWLVYDQAGQGKVDSALQLFGNVTFWMFWDHGYEPLAALDDNHDGELRGEELRSLAIWCDANQNGISEPGEVKPLSQHGIVALSVRHTTDEQHADRIQQSDSGVTFADGTTRATYDLILQPK